MIAAAHSTGRSRALLGVALRWTAGILVLLLLAYFLPIAPLRVALAQIPPALFVLVLVGYLLAHAAGAAKWRMVVNAAGAGLDYSIAVQCYFGGLFGTLFLPSILGGDVIRLAVALGKSPRPAAVVAGNVADRVVDVAALAGLTLLGVALFPTSLPLTLQTYAWRVLEGLALLLLVLLALFLLLRRALLGGRSIRFRRRLARVRHSLRAVSRQPQVLVFALLLGLSTQAVFVLLTALLAHACGLLLPLRAWLFAWPLAKLAALLPVTQGGVGVREAALVALLVPFGAASPLVFAAGLAWEGVIIAGGLCAGLLVFLVRRSNRPENQA